MRYIAVLLIAFTISTVCKSQQSIDSPDSNAGLALKPVSVSSPNTNRVAVANVPPIAPQPIRTPLSTSLTPQSPQTSEVAPTKTPKYDGGFASNLNISDWIALVALIVSVFVAIYTFSLQQRLVKIEEAREIDRLNEASRAKLRVSAVEHRGETKWDDRAAGKVIIANSYFVKIRNDGKAAAHDINIQFDGEQNHPAIKRVAETYEISPDGEVVYELVDNVKLPVFIKIIWSDDSGNPGEYQTVLNYKK